MRITASHPQVSIGSNCASRQPSQRMMSHTQMHNSDTTHFKGDNTPQKVVLDKFLSNSHIRIILTKNYDNNLKDLNLGNNVTIDGAVKVNTWADIGNHVTLGTINTGGSLNAGKDLHATSVNVGTWAKIGERANIGTIETSKVLTLGNN